MRRVIGLVAPLLRSRPAAAFARWIFAAWVAGIARDDPPRAIRRLLEVHDELYWRIDALAARLDGGVHVKHRLIGYHDFFVGRVRPGERVLDVGCGKGELAHDLAERGGAFVTGVDLKVASIAFARTRFSHPRLELVEADATTFDPDARYDVVVLSNVLEHIDGRVELLRHLADTTRAERFLIRVPVLERHWLVPLRRELGLLHFSDADHVLEYDLAGLRSELDAAGLELDDAQIRWGEIWAEARVRRA